MKKILLFASLFVVYTTKAQQLSDKQYKEEYRRAVQLYANNQFEEAIQRFLPLTKNTYTHSMVPYSHYYLSLCANNITNFSQSRQTLTQLIERFPGWKHIDEAYYLLAEANFGENYTENALEVLTRIVSPTMEKDIENMTYKYISSIESISDLKKLYEKFPTNKTIALILIEKIQDKTNPTKEELRLSDQLTNRFSFDKIKQNKSTSYLNDNNVSIGLLFPFNLQNSTTDSRSNNQFVFDMYIGMKMATKKLNEEGISTQLYTFDIGKDENDFLKLTSNKNLNSLDLFVGPLYTQANKSVVNYSYKNEIFQVHPLSNNSSLIENDERIFLAQPSYKDQAERAIDDFLAKSTKKTLSIYFGNSKKDSLFAAEYAQTARNKGFNVLEIKHFYTQLSVSSSNANGHIFVSCEPDEATSLLRGIRKQKQVCPVYISGSSINIDKISKDLLQNQVNILYPEYLDKDKDEVEYFRSKYINENGTIPSYFSYLGYDLVYFWGKMLKDGKRNLRNNLNLIEYTQGYLLSGFDFTSNSNSNRIIPIVNFTENGFKEIGR